jgi:hypothetical protein
MIDNEGVAAEVHARDLLAHERPQGSTATWVETGRRFVEEDHALAGICGFRARWAAGRSWPPRTATNPTSE